ncbi:hypothetical protein BH11BAC1_BH11BAC1_09950 [soil metagenome]
MQLLGGEMALTANLFLDKRQESRKESRIKSQEEPVSILKIRLFFVWECKVHY